VAAFCDERGICINLIHGVHGHPLDVFRKRYLDALLHRHDMTGNGMVFGNHLLLGQLFQCSETAATGIDFEFVSLSRNHAEILKEAMGGDRRGQGVDIGLAILLANIAWRSNEVVEGDKLDRLKVSSHG